MLIHRQKEEERVAEDEKRRTTEAAAQAERRACYLAAQELEAARVAAIVQRQADRNAKLAAAHAAMEHENKVHVLKRQLDLVDKRGKVCLQSKGLSQALEHC